MIQKLLYNQPDNRLDNNDILDRIIVSLRQKQRQKQLFKATRSNIWPTNKDNPGLCQKYDVIRHYLNTSINNIKRKYM